MDGQFWCRESGQVEDFKHFLFFFLVNLGKGPLFRRGIFFLPVLKGENFFVRKNFPISLFSDATTSSAFKRHPSNWSIIVSRLVGPECLQVNFLTLKWLNLCKKGGAGRGEPVDRGAPS